MMVIKTFLNRILTELIKNRLEGCMHLCRTSCVIYTVQRLLWLPVAIKVILKIQEPRLKALSHLSLFYNSTPRLNNLFSVLFVFGAQKNFSYNSFFINYKSGTVQSHIVTPV